MSDYSFHPLADILPLIEGDDFEIGAMADRAAIGCDLTYHKLDQRRLAGTVRAKQRKNLAAANIEVDALERPL